MFDDISNYRSKIADSVKATMPTRRLSYIDISSNAGITFQSVARYICATSSVDKIVVSKSMIFEGDQNRFDVSVATDGEFKLKTRPGQFV